MQIKKRMLVFPFIILIYCLFLFAGKLNTYAWFTAEINASGEITNATTKDLLSISTSDVTYYNNCEISQNITIENISTIMIPIKLIDQNQALHPGETFTTTIKQKVSCKDTDVNYHLLGLNHYIDEMINVPLDQNKLSATADHNQKTQEESNQPTNSMIEEKNDPAENDEVEKENSAQ
ncbi:hypothetical protein H5P36_13935 [Bacillus sp. APMAM]|nr:hypothetical protein [Bacillus sp. APMAM]RTZ55338.1 hypothetical protein EKO25_13180 [Bacillus sp. SAJ1]